MSQIPIAIFAYNRPSHLKRLLISLEGNKIINLNFFLDGARNKKDRLIQEQILSMLKNSKFKTKIYKQKKNLGLAKSIELGLNIMSKRYKHFIVLEDDVIPYKNFLKFIKINLRKYNDKDHIAAICGYQLKEINNKKKKENNSIELDYFIPWGWATWSKKWIDYINERNKFLKKIKINKKNYIEKVLKYKIEKKPEQIWSAKYILFNLSKKKKFIFPTSTLSKNIGFDGSGINSKITNNLSVIEQKNLKINFNKILVSKSLEKTQYEVLKKKINYFY